jgi:hypothetical protein
MLRIASAAFVLFTVLISTSVIPSSSAEAGYYGVRYGGLCGGAVYGPPVYGPRGYGYRGGYYGRSNRPLATAPYYVNGCYNGYSDDGVYCYVYVGCPTTDTGTNPYACPIIFHARATPRRPSGLAGAGAASEIGNAAAAHGCELTWHVRTSNWHKITS